MFLFCCLSCWLSGKSTGTWYDELVSPLPLSFIYDKETCYRNTLVLTSKLEVSPYRLVASRLFSEGLNAFTSTITKSLSCVCSCIILLLMLSVFDRCFTSLCYTADGKCILAGGRSKFVCIYHVDQQVGTLIIQEFLLVNLWMGWKQEYIVKGTCQNRGQWLQ